MQSALFLMQWLLHLLSPQLRLQKSYLHWDFTNHAAICACSRDVPFALIFQKLCMPISVTVLPIWGLCNGLIFAHKGGTQITAMRSDIHEQSFCMSIVAQDIRVEKIMRALSSLLSSALPPPGIPTIKNSSTYPTWLSVSLPIPCREFRSREICWVCQTAYGERPAWWWLAGSVCDGKDSIHSKGSGILSHNPGGQCSTSYAHAPQTLL